MKVGELIERLSRFDKNLDVIIEDADTEWLLNISQIITRYEDTGANAIALRGDYGDLYTKIK